MQNVEILELATVREKVDELAHLIQMVVDDGASIGFLPPMKLSTARSYWENAMEPGVILYIAKIDNEIAGTVQVHFCPFFLLFQVTYQQN
ncbi:hypothetical protein HPT25_10695 [Bacillus sp. BRMEA1]|uniref:hypothetical protein n=1 Tax=Neobacillus endophyticus TaxID=2738405 RepID=UPI001564B16A|nr:hypothetical protein [Neobacillus endophyticus]NRD77877.1 hypothetical protein [Neobacillus endophyticus]